MRGTPTGSGARGSRNRCSVRHEVLGAHEEVAAWLGLSATGPALPPACRPVASHPRRGSRPRSDESCRWRAC